MLRLSACQSVTTQIPQRSVALHHYLKQPRRLVKALMNPAQVEELGAGNFRLTLRAIQFFMLNIRPVVDLHIESNQSRLLKVRSVACTISGNEYINQRFNLSLCGNLQIDDQGHIACVKGIADLAIAVDLPPMMHLTPYTLLEKTGNQILKGILATMKQRLVRQLAADYHRWSDQQMKQATSGLTISAGGNQVSCLDS